MRRGGRLSAIAHPLRRGDIVGLAPTIGVGLALLASRQLFPARSDQASVREGLRWLALGGALVYAYGTVACG